VMDQPRTNRTNLNQPKNVEVGPGKSVAAEGVSEDGPTGPTKNSKLSKKDKKQETGERASGNSAESLKKEVGPVGPMPPNSSDAGGFEWTPPPAEVGPEVGPGPVSPEIWPVWLPDLLAIREANPDCNAYTWALLLDKHVRNVRTPKVKEVLMQWDAHQALATPPKTVVITPVDPWS
jgi:hypothetical protein